MLGAIIGDIIGSRFEGKNNRSESFELFTKNSHFTDDTVLTVALADSILSGISYREKLYEYRGLYPNAGYGSSFNRWAGFKLKEPYNSYGNGSAMRVSPVGWAYDDLSLVLTKAKESAEVTHNHPEGIKGAQAVAASIFLARTGVSKKEIKKYLEKHFRYKFNFNLERLRRNYKFDISCQGTVPQAIFTFFKSNSFEDSIRKAISIGGDSDTIACISGGIAEAFYHEIPQSIIDEAKTKLDYTLLKVLINFRREYN